MLVKTRAWHQEIRMGFWPGARLSYTVRPGQYTRVSRLDQQTLPMQTGGQATGLRRCGRKAAESASLPHDARTCGDLSGRIALITTRANRMEMVPGSYCTYSQQHDT